MFNLARRFLHVGQKIPQQTIVTVGPTIVDKFDMQKDVDSSKLFKGKVVLLSFPGAFTPTCTSTHVPSFIEKYQEIKSKGAEVIALTVNDCFVVKEFAQELKAPFTFICDGSGTFTKSLDAGVDLSAGALGYRSRRFTALVVDGEITLVNDEQGPGFTEVSAVETIIAALN